MALENVFGYLGLSALCGYEELNEDKRLLPDGATLLEQSRFTYGGAIHSSVELFLTDNLLFVLKAQGRLLFGSDLHRFRPAISAGLKSYFPLQIAFWRGKYVFLFEWLTLAITELLSTFVERSRGREKD